MTPEEMLNTMNESEIKAYQLSNAERLHLDRRNEVLRANATAAQLALTAYSDARVINGQQAIAKSDEVGIRSTEDTLEAWRKYTPDRLARMEIAKSKLRQESEVGR